MRPNDINSLYPDMIDDRMLFCDANISQMPIIKEYEKYINDKEYDLANNIINSINVDYFGAYVMNHLENRLYAISRYVLNLDGNGRVKVHLQCMQNTEPTNAQISSSKKYTHWISD